MSNGRRRGNSASARFLNFLTGFIIVAILGGGTLVYFLACQGQRPNQQNKPASPESSQTQPQSLKKTEMPEPPTEYSSTELTEIFELTIEPQVRHFGTQLVVLENQRPSGFRAVVKQVRPLPKDLSEAGKDVRWSASAGMVQDAPTSAATAIFTPPADSQIVELHARCTVELRQTGRSEPLKAKVEASLKLLTPVASGTTLIDGKINGYPIGHYLTAARPEELKKYKITTDWFKLHPRKYDVPEFFYKIETAGKPLLVSPHVPLEMFTIDFPWKTLGMPQYIALDLNLVQKIEDLQALMQSEGVKMTRFRSIYGFRPPVFNLDTLAADPKTLKEPLSMHQYGRALDLIIDEDDDGQLDDLNGDGKFDVYDAGLIMYYVNQLDRKYRAEGNMDLVGGAGIYWENDFVERNKYFRERHPRQPRSTAYVHIDARGFTGEKGKLIRWSDKESEAWPDGDLIQWKNPYKEYWTTPEHRHKLVEPESGGSVEKKSTNPKRPAKSPKPASTSRVKSQ